MRGRKRCLLVWSCLTGLLCVANGCGSKKEGGSGGRGGSAGAAGIAGAAVISGMGGGGDAGGAGGAGIGGSVATGGSASTAGSGGSGGTAGTGGSAATGGSAGAGAAGSGGSAGGSGGTAGAGGAIPFYPLGMNDVTILAPLPQSIATPVLLRGADLADDGTAFVPRTLYNGLAAHPLTGSTIATTVQPYEIIEKHDRLHLVAVRFDLCDRHLPGACPADEDARMRLVFQLVADGSGAEDVGFHAFYTIRNDEIAAAVGALRDLARIAPPQSGAVRVSPALTAADPAAYAAKLRAFVKRYGGEARLVRLTINAINFKFSSITWELRGVERNGNAFVAIPIVGSTATSEEVSLAGDPGYDVRPTANTPSGLEGAIRSYMFDAADTATKRAFLGVLAAVDNPMSHTAETAPCVACHVSTVILNARALATAIDPLTLPGRYTSKFDLSITGGQSATTRNTIRAFGYLGKQPMISQRVVNDTAQTLTEIEERFPAP